MDFFFFNRKIIKIIKLFAGGEEVKRIKNLIFDLDNTLYDFSAVWKESNKLVFDYLGYNKLTSYEEFFKEYKRINNELVEKIHNGKLRIIDLRNERLKRTLEHYGVDLSKEECDFYYKKQFEFILECIKPDLEINARLKKLSKNYNLIILTNGKSFEQRMKLKKLELEGMFKLYISEETKMSKPKEIAFINVLNNEGMILEETMMIGDSLFHDIEPAEKLGMKTCLVQKRWHFDDEDVEYEGYKVKNIKEFLDKL